MKQLVINGPVTLRGEVRSAGAKNSVLKILAASLLTDGRVTIGNVPNLYDVTTMLELLGHLGVKTVIDEKCNVDVYANTIRHFRAPYDLVRSMRASFMVLGPILAHYGHAEVSLPGGDAIGSRPVDQHLAGLKAMGADIHMKEGYLIADVKGRLKGTRHVFDLITVGGTEHLMMAATLAEGRTLLENCAREPEIVDLAECLIAMGAQIQGHGSDTIVIDGVGSLSGCSHQVIPDRVEAGTYLIAASATGGQVRVRRVVPDHLDALIQKLSAAGAELTIGDDWIELDMHGRRPNSVNLTTSPYPGFPTDLQAQMVTLNAVATGTSTVRETVFENRFMHIHEMNRMGADIRLLPDSTTAVIEGIPRLSGAQVTANDLRASFSLVIAGLAAEGRTLIDNIHHIDRGYEQVEEKLRLLGADVQRLG